MKFLLTFFSLIALSFSLHAQQAADAVLGVWKNGEGTGHIEIYKTTSGHYAGKIIWLKEPIDPDTGKPKLDKHNSDKAKCTQPVLNMVNMHGFKYNDEDKIWEGGKIYDPKNGKEYSCKMEFKDANTLKVRGFIGISLIGRTDNWTRIK
ncbi:MAG: DUF2147 domain-containing protein [Chitinophagaceae bacterium]|nr:DUF2147 domain-containing protein [Chitinophagaceae bacterium]